MTKKHFEAIAKLLNQWAERNPDIRWIIYKDLVEAMALYLKTQNPLFDEARFYKACQTTSWKITHIS